MSPSPHLPMPKQTRFELQSASGWVFIHSMEKPWAKLLIGGEMLSKAAHWRSAEQSRSLEKRWAKPLTGEALSKGTS